MKPFVNGLISAYDVVNPFSSSQFDEWPFPQLVRGFKDTLLCGASDIYSVDESTWELTLLSLYESSDLISSGSIVAGGTWHFIDLQESWLLLNGSSVVFKPGTHLLFGEEEKILIQSAITINTGCSMFGRVLFGGFDTSNFIHVDWQSVTDYWADKLPYNVDTMLQLTNGNFIWWSTIGGGDVFHTFFPDDSVTGLIKEDETASVHDPLYMDMLKRNERGLMPMPWNGTVYNIKPLGKGAMVYGDEGSAYVFPATDPIATLGCVEVMKVGIAGRGSVGGDDKRHIFIDSEGSLWTIGSNIQPERLGYKEFFEPLLDNDIIISYDKKHDWFYISGKDQWGDYYSYVLTKQGLGEAPQIITSAINIGDSFVGVYTEQDESDTEVLVVSDVVDFGNRDLKTVTTIELSMEIDSDTDVYVAVDSRLDSYGSWTRSTFKQLNTQGWMRVQQTAVEFRFVIKVSTYENTRIDSMNIHYQQAGKSTIRGIGLNVSNQ